MPDTKISALGNASGLIGLELLVLVQPHTPPRSNKKITVQDLFSAAPVQSVNSKTGAVSLTASDVGAIASGDNISQLVNDVGYITGGSQPAHFVFAGPTSGGNSAPGFRALVASDIPALPYLTTNQTITLSGAVTGSGATSIATTLANNIVTNAKLRDSTGLSVVGRSANSSGDPADIVASADGDILRRSGTTLSFGGIGIGSITMSTNRLLGRTTASSGPVEEIQVQGGLTLSGGILGLGGTLTQSVTGLTSLTNDKEFMVAIGSPSSTNRAMLRVVGHENISNTMVEISAHKMDASSLASFTIRGTGQLNFSNHTGASFGLSSSGLQIILGSDATGDTFYRNSAGIVARRGIGSEGQVYTVSGGLPVWDNLPSSQGTVSSFSAGNLSGLFTTSVANATTTPSLTFSAVSQDQRLFLASPVSSSGNPSFRAIGFLDIPRDQREVSGSVTVLSSDLGKILYCIGPTTIIIPNGLDTNFEFGVFRASGADLVTIQANGVLITLNNENTLQFDGASAYFTHKGSNIWYGTGALGVTTLTNGTVTSFSANDLSPLFTSSVSNANTTPSLSFTLSSQTQNLVFASPDQVTGEPLFRSLTDFDLPNFRIQPSGVAQYVLSAQDNMSIIYCTNTVGTDIRMNSGLGTGYSVLIWRSAAAGPVTFSTGTGVTFEGAGQTMEMAKTSVMLVNAGNENYIAAGAIGDFGGGGSGTGGHVIKEGGTSFSNKPNLNFLSGFNVSNSASDTEVTLGGTLRNSIIWSGDAGQHTVTMDNLLTFKAQTQNGQIIEATSFSARLGSANGSDIRVNQSGDVTLSYSNETRRLSLNTNGVNFDLGSDAVGDMYVRNSSGRFTRLPAVATGNVIISQGVNTAPGYGKVGLTTHVSGTLPVASGGTGITTYTQGDLIYSNATNSLSKLPKGGANTILGMNNAGSVQEYKTVQNALTSSSGSLELGGPLTHNTTISGSFGLTFSNSYWTFGSRTSGTSTNSMSVGSDHVMNNQNTFAAGFGHTINNGSGAAFGTLNVVSGDHGFSVGWTNTSSGTASFTAGSGNIASHGSSMATGAATRASGLNSWSGGRGFTTGGRFLFASGTTSFNFSENTTSQTAGHGAQADNSAILGGINHNIESGNSRAAIIGGSGIKLTGTTYIDTVAVPNFAIFLTPGDGGSDDVLTWNSTTKKIGKVSQASLGGGGSGTVTSVGIIAPASGITVSGSPITSSGSITLALNNDLLALENLGSTGFAVRTASNTWAQRTITGGTGISVSNGNGISGNPSISLSHLGIQSLTSPGADRILFWDQSQGSSQWLTVGSGLQISGTTLSATAGGSGTVTSVAASAPAAGFTISGSPITTSGTLTFNLANDLAALEGLSGNGFAVRNGTDSWINRTIDAGTGISVSNGNGVSANPSISLSHLGIQNLSSPGADRIMFWDQSAAATGWLTVGSGLSISGTTLSATQTLDSGTYTPTFISGSSDNVDSVTFHQAQYMRVGNVVTLSGQVTINPTASGQVLVHFTPPIASESTFNTASGVVVQWTGGIFGSVAGVPDPPVHALAIQFMAPDGASQFFMFTCTYEVR